MAQLLNGQTRNLDTTTIVMNATYYTWSYEVFNLIGDWRRFLLLKTNKIILNLFFASLSPLPSNEASV